MAFIRSGGFRKLLLAVVVVTFVVGAGLAYLIHDLLRDLPEIRSVADYRPPLTTRVLDREDRLIGEFYTERRSLAPMGSIPRHVQLAFVAAEDANFFEHSGIDYISIVRAAWVDLTEGKIKQGASTITMQLVKQLLLSSERTFQRKFREMYLAREIELDFSKEEILWLYLNQIYFGQGAWGISEAARTYYGKTVAELTVSDAALLAGLPQRPSDYSPFRRPEPAERRRRYVLGRMLADDIIDRESYEQALAEPPIIDVDQAWQARQDYAPAAYFTEEVRRYLFETFGGEFVLTGGLTVRTTLDLELQRAAVAAVKQGIENHDTRQGYRGEMKRVSADSLDLEIERLALANEIELSELGVIEELVVGRVLEGVVTEVDKKSDLASVSFGAGARGRVELADVSWARKPDPTRRLLPRKHIEQVLSVGDVAQFRVIESAEAAQRAADEREDAEAKKAGVEATSDEPDKSDESDELAALSEDVPPQPTAPQRLTLDQKPEVQGALFSLEVATGNVLALVGGYDYFQSEFNRVTQAKRQPGSAFKPFIYGAAIAHHYSPVSTLWDRPAVYTDPISGFVWRPQNYGREFYGPMPMRTALVRSVNNATVHLFRDLGVDYVMDFARRLGIQSPMNRDLSLALGSSDVSLLEITTAYAVFPNHGRRVVPRFILSVTGIAGELLAENVTLGKPPPPVAPYVPLEEEARELDSAVDVAAGGPGQLSIDADLADENGGSNEPIQIIGEDAAYLMCDMLKGVVSDPRGTGWRLKQLKRPLAGKTGTTNDQADAWFLGFSPDIATGVWVGHDESHVLGKGETGSRAAAPIWVNFMRVALEDRPVRDFEVPEHIEFHRIDRATGLLADSTTKDAYFQPFLENTQPTRTTANVTSASDARRALRDDSF